MKSTMEYTYQSGGRVVYSDTPVDWCSIVDFTSDTADYATYDIETNNIELEKDDKVMKFAEPYLYQIGYHDVAFITHSRSVFLEQLQNLQYTNALHTARRNHKTINKNRKLFLFAHNGQKFDSTFFVDLLSDAKNRIFPDKTAMRFEWHNIVFRDTIKTMPGSLAKVGENYTSGKYAKLDTLEHNNSHSYEHGTMTRDELEYAMNDVLLLFDAIAGYKTMNNIARTSSFPLTECSKTKKEYFNDIHAIEDKKTKYSILHRIKSCHGDYRFQQIIADGFEGGNTGVGKNCSNVLYQTDDEGYITGADITTAHPFQTFTKKFCASTPIQIENPTVDMIESIENTDDIGFLAVVEYAFKIKDNIKTSSINVKENSYLHQQHIPSSTDIWGSKLQQSDKYIDTINQTKLSIIKSQCSEFKLLKVRELYTFRIAYMSRVDANRVSTAFVAKTQFDGVEGKEQEYQSSKVVLNTGSFGMYAKKQIRDEYEFDDAIGEVVKTGITSEEDWTKTNTNSRTLPRIWGYEIAQYTRQQQVSFINAVQEIPGAVVFKYDTDSITCKIPHSQRHVYQQMLDDINNTNRKLLEKCCHIHRIKYDSVLDVQSPAGIFKTLGKWTEEHVNDQYFIPIGTKHYVYVQEDGKDKWKCAGLNSMILKQKIIKLAGSDKIEDILHTLQNADSIYISADENVDCATIAGVKPKLAKIHTQKNPLYGMVLDGHRIVSPSCTALTPATFTLSKMNANYIWDVQQKCIQATVERMMRN